MYDNQTVPAYRVISLLTMLQAAVVVSGTLFVAAMCKFSEFGSHRAGFAFLPAALFVRNFGWTLLFVPVCWAALATAVVRSEINPWVHRALVLIALALVLVGVYLYAQLGFHPTNDPF